MSDRAFYERFSRALLGRRCFAGLDLSATSDLTACCLDFPAPALPGMVNSEGGLSAGMVNSELRIEKEEGGGATTEGAERHGREEINGEVHYLLARFWLPRENVDVLEKKSRAPYRRWADEGWIELTPGDMVDLATVRKGILAWAAAYDVVNWRYDPHRAVGLVTQLDEEDGLEMVRFNQSNIWMHAPTEDFELSIRRRTVIHGGHPVFDWMMGNCEYNRDAQDRIRIVKTRGKERFKVDGPVAAVMARDGSMRDVGGGMVIGADDIVVGGS